MSPSPLDHQYRYFFPSTYRDAIFVETLRGTARFQSHVILCRHKTRRISRVPLGEEIERYSSWLDGAQMERGFLCQGKSLKTSVLISSYVCIHL